MARIFITGSTEGLGLAAGQHLLAQGHEVIFHARTQARAAALSDIKTAGVVIGDLASADAVRGLADQVRDLGPLDAVIHNAGVYDQKARNPTPEDHAATLAINVLAPFLLTALLPKPGRLIYMSSGLHRGGEGPIDDIDWRTRSWDGGQAYAESKLYIVALALGLARRWPDVISHAVDPGWVRTRMGGSNAPVDIDTGQRTQSWLGVSDGPAVTQSGGYWKAQRREPCAPQARDEAFQDALINQLEALTGESLANAAKA